MPCDPIGRTRSGYPRRLRQWKFFFGFLEIGKKRDISGLKIHEHEWHACCSVDRSHLPPISHRSPPPTAHHRHLHRQLLPNSDSPATETAALTDAFIDPTTVEIIACWSAMFDTMVLLATRICSVFCAAIVDICAVEVDSIVLIATELAALIVSSWAATEA